MQNFKIYVGAGTGDLINTMVTAGIAVGMLMLIKDKFGSTAGCNANRRWGWICVYRIITITIR